MLCSLAVRIFKRLNTNDAFSLLEHSFVAQDIWIVINRWICRLVLFPAIPIPYLESNYLKAIWFVKNFEFRDVPENRSASDRSKGPFVVAATLWKHKLVFKWLVAISYLHQEIIHAIDKREFSKFSLGLYIAKAVWKSYLNSLVCFIQIDIHDSWDKHVETFLKFNDHCFLVRLYWAAVVI